MNQQRRSPENHALQDENRPRAHADGDIHSGQISFEDDEVMSLSDRNGPSDPDRGPSDKRS